MRMRVLACWCLCVVVHVSVCLFALVFARVRNWMVMWMHMQLEGKEGVQSVGAFTFLARMI